jgi:hypothetical protein
LSVVPWGRVSARAPAVAIVAGGPSVRAVPREAFVAAAARGVFVLAVNQAIDWLPSLDGWFTLDPSAVNRRIMVGAGRRPRVLFYAAVPECYGDPAAADRILRAPPEPGVTFLRRLIDPTQPLGQRFGLSADPGAIHTGNSAWGALQVAVLMGARRIALLGVDGARDAGYAYAPGCPRGSLDHLPRLFDSAIPQLQALGIFVVNGSLASLVTCFPRVDPVAALEWCSGATIRPEA